MMSSDGVLGSRSTRSSGRSIAYLVILGLAGLSAITAVAADSPDETPAMILWPAPDEASASSNRPAHATEPFVTRVGTVMLDVNSLVPEVSATARSTSQPASLQQRRLRLGFFPDQSIVVVVDTETRPATDILNLGARREGEELSTLSMTVTRDSYVMTFQDLPAARVYRVQGQTDTGAGEVTEIDLRKMPPVLYSPPIIAPSQ